MRKGFTMIELIFVIVILGILAAVAIPKLTATRDDAQVAKGLSEIGMAIRDMGSYYTASGDFNTTNPDEMTNVTLSTGATAGDLAYETTGGECIGFDFNASTGLITVNDDGTASDAVCTGIQGSDTYTNELDGEHKFGGSSIF